MDTLKTQLQKKNQQIERYAAERAELEKRVGDYPQVGPWVWCVVMVCGPQACAALEKQLKFATDRIERADEEKKELQEVLRAWEAENLRLRTQVVKLMEQQVHSRCAVEVRIRACITCRSKAPHWRHRHIRQR